jgi:hypothetical protein
MEETGLEIRLESGIEYRHLVSMEETGLETRLESGID